MITEKDLKEINENLEGIKQARKLNIKAKATVVLENGTEALIYHLGQANDTIRIDIKGCK
ncbi:hypothetical protein PMY38_13745 [Clostridium tertium]|jgi:hypothetical protein|uniref:hypothetical protein n=1 Tax=Clostridium tertium TaxID=1559 RepID=UPI002028D1BB|nr:hypothetical protein [Clostridium tertium]MDB1956366.1 hypothetical protein [Clostridium tertium]MDB1959662.1 hypothetical protein [Clostridium tertium]MDB1961542.1 hypothetical protein [Clostridium tertium]MDB1967274.1 hypothetical protein [Clostridium tertium]